MSVSQAGGSLSCPGDLGLGVLLPWLAGVVVEMTAVAGDTVRCWVRSRSAGACCPECGTWSEKVHDSYVRRLADAGIGGRRVVLHLRTRLLACPDPECVRGTFAEQLEGLRRIGCHRAQGYLFSRPVAADGLIRLLAREVEGEPGEPPATPPRLPDLRVV